MIEAIAKTLEQGLGLKREHQKILIRTGWVFFVTGHVLWVCGWLTAMGLASPFASAADVDKLLRAAQVNARISMQTELRVQIRAWCIAEDPEIRQLAWRRIDELRSDLLEIAKIQTPEPECRATVTAAVER